MVQCLCAPLCLEWCLVADGLRDGVPKIGLHYEPQNQISTVKSNIFSLIIFKLISIFSERPSLSAVLDIALPPGPLAVLDLVHRTHHPDIIGSLGLLVSASHYNAGFKS